MSSAADVGASVQWAPDRLLVRLQSGLANTLARQSGRADAAAYLAGRVLPAGAAIPASVEPVFTVRASGLGDIYRVSLPAGSDVRKACDEFAAAKEVIWAEPEYIYHCQMTPNDPYYVSNGTWGQSYADMWGLRSVEPEPAWDLTQGEGVIVAVIDTGVDYNHEDFYRDLNANGQLDAGEQYNIWINPAEDLNHNGLADAADFNGVDDDGNGFIDDLRGWNFISANNNPLDDHGHGTHVGGTIAAIADNRLGIAGVAPRARLMAVKSLGSNGSGTSAQLANGIVYAANNGARVLNNSWGGGGTSQAILDAIQYARAHNCVVVAAAGNMATNAAFFVPASAPGVLTVAALGADLQRASFSNFGSLVEVSAPGVDVLSLRAAGTDMYKDGNHFVPPGQSTAQYYRANGTSMACPFAAGVAALVIARDPSLPECAVRRAVHASTTAVSSPSLYLGTGLVRCADALTVAGGVARIEGTLSAPTDREVWTAQSDAPVIGRVGAGAYTLEIGPGYYPTSWEVVASGVGPVDGLLTTLSLAGREGPYHLRLTLQDATGTGHEHTVFFADSSLHVGWPVNVGGSYFLFGDLVLGCSYAATTADVDADGDEEIFVDSGGFTFGFAGDGRVLHGWPSTQSQYPAYLSNNDLPGPSIEDTDRDGVPEVFWTLRDYYPDYYGSPWTAWCFNAKTSYGANLGAFPRQAPDTYSNAFELPFVLGDLDGDGDLEAVAAHTLGNNAEAYRLSAFDRLGTRLWTRDLVENTASIVGLSFGDLDGNGVSETVAISSTTVGSRPIYLHALDANGLEQSGYPVLLYNAANEYSAAPPFLADIDNDGDLEVVLAIGGAQSRVRFYHHDGTAVAGAGVAVGNYDCQILDCVLGDLDADGQPEVITTANYRPIGVGYGSYRVYAARFNGAVLPGWPFLLAEWPSSRPAVVDVDNDGRQDVCFTTNAGAALNTGLLFAVSGEGAIVPGYPRMMSFGSTSGVTAGDVDGDGLFELVTATMTGSIYVWDLPTPALVSRADWPVRHMNRRNANVFGDRAWPVAPGDTDIDGDVDESDLIRFLECVSGPSVPYTAARRCRRLDFDGDEDIDQCDFGVFQRCISGVGRLADVDCGA